MANALLIIHGYSDGAGSFHALKNYFIKRKHYKRENVFLLDYASMDDDASFLDFADKLNQEYEDKISHRFKRIDVAVHSTGSLIVRAWLALRAKRTEKRGKKFFCPVDRLLMFAPANFGSDLAKLGQSFLGKVNSTFFNRASKKKELLESGKVVLQGLEPASPFQWELSNIDLVEKSYLGGSGGNVCYPFVFAAGEFYGGLQSRIVKNRKKPGTDGTVRICGTSLNARKCRVNFCEESVEPRWVKQNRAKDIPFCVFDGFNHGTIAKSTRKFDGDARPEQLIDVALKVKNAAQYREAVKEFERVNKLNYQKMDEEYDKKYQQFFFKVGDDVGLPVKDYYVDFYVVGADEKEIDEELTEVFDEHFESQFHTHSADASCRVMMVRCDSLQEFSRVMVSRKRKLVFDVTGSPPIRGISYKKGHCIVWDAGKKQPNRQSFICPNTTTMVEVVLNRIEGNEFLEVYAR